MRALVTAALLVLISTTAMASTDEAASTTRIISDVVQRIHTLVMTAPSDDEMRTQVKTILEEFVDFPEFGRLCLGRHWPELKPAQQEEYLTAFRLLLQNNYLRRFKRGQDFTVKVSDKPRLNQEGDRIEVASSITTPSDNVTVDVHYRFYRTPKGWKVYDIVVDEVSMMRNYRKSFSGVYSKDGFTVLLDKMTKKTADLLEGKTDKDDL